MKFDGLIGAFVIMGIDVGAFCFNLAALSYVSPYTGGADDLCDLAPVPSLCNYAQQAITAPWILYMRPDCIGTRMATCVMHFTVSALQPTRTPSLPPPATPRSKGGGIGISSAAPWRTAPSITSPSPLVYRRTVRQWCCLTSLASLLTPRCLSSICQSFGCGIKQI